ncbi:hypothetical protein NPIL_48751, partial [Nephila pilipes]
MDRNFATVAEWMTHLSRKQDFLDSNPRCLDAVLEYL